MVMTTRQIQDTLEICCNVVHYGGIIVDTEFWQSIIPQGVNEEFVAKMNNLVIVHDRGRGITNISKGPADFDPNYSAASLQLQMQEAAALVHGCQCPDCRAEEERS